MKFSYFLPTKLSFGYGVVDGLGSEILAAQATKVLVVTDKVMVKTGIAGRVEALIPSKVSHDTFDGVEPEPRIEVAQAVAEKVRSGGYDLVVGVGGGSSLDMAKVAGGFATNSGEALEFVGNDRFSRNPVPTVMVPTTAGTGAELTVTSMVTVEGHKQWINSPKLLPTLALVDPELTLSMPQSVTAATGMDALCHNTEAYFSNFANPLTDSAALEGIGLIVRHLENVFDSPQDRRAREAMSLGATLGGVALHAKMVYGHSVGYTIATRLRLAHGVSCGIPLPYIIANYSIACAPKMKKLAEAFGVDPQDDDPIVLGKKIAEKAMSIASHLKIPTNLREAGVAEEDLASLAKECVEMYPRTNSPLVFDEKAMVHFYRMMWEGSLSA